MEVWAVKSLITGLVKSELLSGVNTTLVRARSTERTTDTGDRDTLSHIFGSAVAQNNHHGRRANEHPAAGDMGLLDVEDGRIYRCWLCMHEIWDGVCTGCNHVYPGHRRHHDEDSEREDSDEEHAPDGYAFLGGQAVWNQAYAYGNWAANWMNYWNNAMQLAQQGMVNGVGMVNGMGMVNGIGMVNGVGQMTETTVNPPPQRHVDEESEGYESSFIDDSETPTHRDIYSIWAELPTDSGGSDSESSGADVDSENEESVRGRRRRARRVVYSDVESDNGTGISWADMGAESRRRRRRRNAY